MISYIIPTLWKCKNIFKTIERFETINDPKSELIIIDNDQKGFKTTHPQIKVISPTRNFYVNPSWQLGINLSKNENICLVNDDIIFDIKRFHSFVLDNKAEGVSFHPANRIEKDNKEWKLIDNNSPHRRPAGGGQLIYFKKKNYPGLPANMKFWYGDDTIYYYNTLIKEVKFSFIEGMAITGEQSVTVNNNEVVSKEYRQHFSPDTLEYYKKMHTLGISCCTVFPLEVKMSWKYGDHTTKLEYEKLIDDKING
tara:strand:- start:133 stop:891 length:759 start_codon:yes stop_codon:yes gene_type:complete